MNEHELRDAFNRVMVASSPPPAMDTQAALDVARRAHRRRRTTLAGAGTALAVVAIAAGAVAAPGLSALRPAPVQPGGQGNASVTETPGPTSTELSNPASGLGTGDPPAEPNEEAVGPGNEKAAGLQEALKSVVPAGYTLAPFTPRSRYLPHSGSPGMYQATVLLAQGDGSGSLYILVKTPRSGLPVNSEPCAAPPRPGVVDCQVIDVAGKQVSMHGPGPDGDWQAQYVYPDGTLVEIWQAQRRLGDRGMPDPPPLETLPFTVQQHAELAVDPRFKME